MTLLELTEPLLLYVCRLSRMALAGTASDISVVHSDINALLAQMKTDAGNDHKLAEQLRQVELPLLFFVDSMIADSQLTFASQWQRCLLAYERNELAGDEKFFDILDQTLPDTSDDATERLAVFYVCLGLGFRGVYAGQPEQLRKYMNQIFPRVRQRIETDETARLCKEAYASVDTRNLVEPPSSKMALIAIIFAFCTLSVLATYYFMFRDASQDLRRSIQQINQHGPTATR